MKTIASYMATMAIVASLAFAPISTFAQVQATMPVLYNQSGQAVNNGTTGPLAAGYYYLQPNQPGTQVYYYGNGTYFDPVTGLYGGSAVNDPYGIAGVSLGYSSTVLQPTTPTVPNTGAGGNAGVTWAILAVSAAVVAAGTAYLATSRKRLATTSLQH